MATYSSAKVTALRPAKAREGDNMAYASVTISAAAANGDLYRFFYVPANATIVAGLLQSTDIDTNGVPTSAIDVGDSGDIDRLFAASQAGRAGTQSTQLATTGLGYTYTADTLIYATHTTGPATGATGTIYLTLFYIVGEY